MEGIILSLLIYVPLVGAVVVLALPQWMAHFYRWIAVGALHSTGFVLSTFRTV